MAIERCWRSILFSLIQVGDAEFTAYVDRHVNSRRIMYVGSGQTDFDGAGGLKYGIGDMIPQMPMACQAFPMPYCPMPILTNPEGLKSFQYVQAGGNIRFFAKDMPNTKVQLNRREE